MERMRETTNKYLLNARKQLSEYDNLINAIREDNVQMINESITELDEDQRVQNVLRRAEVAEEDCDTLIRMVEDCRGELHNAQQDYQDHIWIYVQWQLEQMNGENP